MLFDLGLTEKQIERLNKYFQMDLSKLNEIFKNTDNEKIQMGLEEVNNLDNYLKQLELNCCNFDVTLARGQNYYTGNVFEVYDKNKRIKKKGCEQKKKKEIRSRKTGENVKKK